MTKEQTAYLFSIISNLTIALAVSFVAISLGASLGFLSGRGAYAGMISAGIIAFITSLLGGTRIQCSGPTAPMSAISAIVVAFAMTHYETHQQSALSPDQFITLCFLMTGGLLALAGFLRLGRFISYVPNIVISGFMSGIALLIWTGQTKVLFGIGGIAPLEGSVFLNATIVVSTVFIMFASPMLLKRFIPHTALFFPGTLVAIILVSLASNALGLDVQHVSLRGNVSSFEGLKNTVLAQWPRGAAWHDFSAALPFALKLTLLCYLDTLLTTLVIDRMTGDRSGQNGQLGAQGLANAMAALVGGIPGAQATIRSVLLVKEGATMRLSGVFAGVFVLIELILFQDLFSYIPQAVLVGVLFKVGYDVFDAQPFLLYIRQILGRALADVKNARVSHLEIAFIIGTMLVTLFADLNTAVLGFTALFYIMNKLILRAQPMADLQAITQTEGLSDEP